MVRAWKGSVDCLQNQKIVFEKWIVVMAASNLMCVLNYYHQNTCVSTNGSLFSNISACFCRRKAIISEIYKKMSINKIKMYTRDCTEMVIIRRFSKNFEKRLSASSCLSVHMNNSAVIGQILMTVDI